MMDQLGGDEFSYLNLRDIVSEVSEAEAEYRKRGYPILDITDLTVEETAAHVLRALNIPGGLNIRGTHHS